MIAFNCCFRDKLDENGVCVRVLGDTTLLPEDLQVLIAKAVTMTAHHNRYCEAGLVSDAN